MGLELKEGEKPDIWLNFKQYGFPLPEVLRMDSSKQRFKHGEYFDCIVCDPPYGKIEFLMIENEGWRASVRTQGLSESKKEKHAKRKELLKQREGQENQGVKEEAENKEEKEEEKNVEENEEQEETTEEEAKSDPQELQSQETQSSEEVKEGEQDNRRTKK